MFCPRVSCYHIYYSAVLMSCCASWSVSALYPAQKGGGESPCAGVSHVTLRAAPQPSYSAAGYPEICPSMDEMKRRIRGRKEMSSKVTRQSPPTLKLHSRQKLFKVQRVKVQKHDKYI